VCSVLTSGDFRFGFRMKKFARLEASLYSRYGSWREPKGVRDATLQLPRCDARTRRLREARKAGRCRPVVERRVGRACLRRGGGLDANAGVGASAEVGGPCGQAGQYWSAWLHSRLLPPLALSPEPARWPLPTRRLSSVAASVGVISRASAMASADATLVLGRSVF
jgi:hypothetical protein